MRARPIPLGAPNVQYTCRVSQATLNPGSQADGPPPSTSSTTDLQSLRLTIEYVPLEQLRPSARRVHKHDVAFIERLKSNSLVASIEVGSFLGGGAEERSTALSGPTAYDRIGAKPRSRHAPNLAPMLTTMATADVTQLKSRVREQMPTRRVGGLSRGSSASAKKSCCTPICFRRDVGIGSFTHPRYPSMSAVTPICDVPRTVEMCHKQTSGKKASSSLNQPIGRDRTDCVGGRSHRAD